MKNSIPDSRHMTEPKKYQETCPELRGQMGDPVIVKYFDRGEWRRILIQGNEIYLDFAVEAILNRPHIFTHDNEDWHKVVWEYTG